MSTELKMLIYAAILGLVQLLAATQAATKVRGLKWNVSPRDQKMPELTGIPGRLDRSFKNFLETFPFFVAATFAVVASGRTSEISALGAQLYFFARLIYWPLYAFGIPYVRTLIWSVSMLGVAILLWTAL
ncbi:MAG: MAPEG family protein [Bdellovibrionaceae bacterium]|nr:MAPEG family protein [Pseudobdellovibrionaceae bacterium]